MNKAIDVKADLSESANKLLTKPAHSAGSAIATVIDFFHNTLLLPMQAYNAKAEANLKKYQRRLEEEIERVPDGKQTEPNMNIWGQTMDSLKWNMDDEQEYIRNMFTKILAADVNSDIKGKVQPAFIEIVKQLSKKDAEFLAQTIAPYRNLNIYEERVFKRKIGESAKPAEHFMLKRYIATISKDGKNGFYDDFEISLDNLKRLGIIIEMTGYWGNKKQVSALEKTGKWQKLQGSDGEEVLIEIVQSGRLNVTALGKDFIEICLE